MFVQRMGSVALAFGLSALMGGAMLWAVQPTHAAGLQEGMAPAAVIRYVSVTGNDASNDCTVLTAPCRTPQRAVDVATSGDSVFVAGGVYTGVQVRAETTQVVYIDKPILIRGGYDAAFVNFDPVANPTKLNAEHPNVAFGIEFPNVLRIQDLVTNVTVEGLHIFNGKVGLLANNIRHITLRQNDIYSNAVGVKLYQSDALTITQNSIAKNIYIGVLMRSVRFVEVSANQISGNGLEKIRFNSSPSGAGVEISGHTIHILQNEIFDNHAESGRGDFSMCWDSKGIGGVFVDGRDTLIADNHIYSNTGGFAAGIYAQGDDSVVVAQNKIYSNVPMDGPVECPQSDTALRAEGVTIYNNEVTGNWVGVETSGSAHIVSNTISNNSKGGLRFSGGQVAVINNVFISNTTNDSGGAVSVVAKASILPHMATIRGNYFAGNTALGHGGAIYIQSSNAVLANNTILSNTAGKPGGGVMMYTSPDDFATNKSHATFSNNIFAENRVISSTVNTPLPEDGFGSGVAIWRGDAEFVHNTFANHTHGFGQAIYGTRDAKLWLTNTILVSNTVGVQVDNNTPVQLNSTLWGNTSNTVGSGILIGSRNYTGNPAFTANYRIQVGSAAAKKGVATSLGFDIDGDRRFNLSTPDLGADEICLTCLQVYLPIVSQGQR